MKFYNCLFFLLLSIGNLSAQLLIPLETEEYYVQSLIFRNSKDRKIEPQVLDSIIFPKEKKIISLLPSTDDADLLIITDLVPLKRKERYTIKLSIVNQEDTIRPSFYMYEKKLLTKNNRKRTFQLTWKNYTEANIFPDQHYKLVLGITKNQLYGFDCKKGPILPKSPFISGAILGGGLSILGLIQRSNTKSQIINLEQDYRQYISAFEEGKAPPIDISEVSYQANLVRANEKNDKQQRNIYLGLGILIVDILAYPFFRRKYKNKLELFNKNKDRCKENYSHSIQISPKIQLTPYNQQLAMNFTYNF